MQSSRRQAESERASERGTSKRASALVSLLACCDILSKKMTLSGVWTFDGALYASCRIHLTSVCSLSESQ